MFDFSKNHFELFGFPVSYVVDTSALAERYRELQKVVHPDRYANASDQEKRLSLQHATLVNEAFNTLKDPLLRAKYLLHLHGVDTDGNETTSDPAFLMQQMEMREYLAAIPTKDDPLSSLDNLMGEIRGMIKNQVAQLTMQFEDATPDQLTSARESISKMQFLNKLQSEAEAVEADLEEMV